MGCRSLGFSAHEILQARILKWFAIPFSRRSSQPRDWTQVSRIVGSFFTSWATRETSCHLFIFLQICPGLEASFLTPRLQNALGGVVVGFFQTQSEPWTSWGCSANLSSLQYTSSLCSGYKQKEASWNFSDHVSVSFFYPSALKTLSASWKTSLWSLHFRFGSHLSYPSLCKEHTVNIQ